ncbi:MAG: tRNA (adenosine(37)-N6)-threonylcarbamoyltransferase complex dimerization subunit type 1 TsaB [Desulfobacteraceae bacterium]|nr:tRNA (adenosine(37)-N6)-threonylcarbamoyltransferase complex dimerization subunit type 1 TsaB [Desulfobacteraceae bacterium]
MRILSLSTAEQGCSLAVFEDKRLICEEYWVDKQTHSKRLTVMVENLLDNRAGFGLSKIDGFIAARGPGSFTGLRIGISVVKGLAYVMSKPDAGVSSLDGIAFRFSSASVPVCVMMDARRNEVYCAVYHFERGNLVSKSDEVVCSPKQAVLSAGENALFVGSGSKAYQELILNLTNQKAVFSCETMDYVSAAALARPAVFNNNFFSNSKNKLEPSYIRKSDAELQFVEKTSILT